MVTQPCPGCGCPYPGDHTIECEWRKRDEILLHALETIRSTIKNLTDAVSGLHKISLHQQEQISRLLKHETDQPV